jgi:predicted ester cyclase
VAWPVALCLRWKGLPCAKAGQEGEESVSEENKAVMHRFYEEWIHSGNEDVLEEIIASDCPLHFGSMFMGTGPEAFKQTRAMMYSGFPDLRFSVEEIIAEGETIAERLTARGTHQGEFMGAAPTGNRVEFPGVAMVHIREGKIAEFKGMPDMLGLMQQIGAVPAPEQAEEASPT